ncbi:MAG: neutral/alkaline non-lysosomal ceramidase N-terminal domain-containing protein [Acidobacteria bacterium]|nr:neutral/alkaline non-lysosomal ceramidase N-terminal domain-containing protein [Acidobacteriota bacterium]
MRTLAVLLLAVCVATAAELRVGTGAVKITPPPGAPMAGYYYNRAADGVHDDLWAKAIVIDAGGERAAIVACDISGLPRPVIEQARREIEKDPGIPPGRVMISATHTHTGPVVLSGPTRYNLQGEMLRIGQQYAADLPKRIAEAVRQAASAVKPARVAAGRGREDSLTFNRRFFLKDGTVGWNPGKRNPNILRPAGPIDPGVPVVLFEAPDGKAMAAHVNYALHLDTVGGTEYSADYPYTLSRLLAQARGDDLLTLFSIGCAGNLNHIDVNWTDRQKGHNEAARIGTVLAGEVLKTMKRLEAMPAGSLRARSTTVELPLAQVRPEDLEWARRITPTFGTDKPAPFMDLVRAFKFADVAERKGAPLEAEVQVIALGDELAWVGLPGEIFTEHGLALKTASPFRYTVISELANGSLGYVPDRRAYPQGAYEAESARCGPGSGEMMVDAAVRMLVELRQAK